MARLPRPPRQYDALAIARELRAASAAAAPPQAPQTAASAPNRRSYEQILYESLFA